MTNTTTLPHPPHHPVTVRYLLDPDEKFEREKHFKREMETFDKKRIINEANKRDRYKMSLDPLQTNLP